MRHAVGQLGAVVGAMGKMSRQKLARRAHAVDEAFGELAFLEVAGHFVGEQSPEFVAAAGMDGHVAKPIAAESLFIAIEAACSEAPPADATAAA